MTHEFPQDNGQFLADRGTREPSTHTLKAYRQDFDGIAALSADPQVLVRLPVAVIDTVAIRSAFAVFARIYEAASIRRCWSTWNVLWSSVSSSVARVEIGLRREVDQPALHAGDRRRRQCR